MLRAFQGMLKNNPLGTPLEIYIAKNMQNMVNICNRKTAKISNMHAEIMFFENS